MKLHFFRRKGIVFIPMHFIGWLYMLVLLVIAALAFYILFFQSLDTEDASTNFLIYLGILVIGYYFFAVFTCKPEEEE